MKTIIKNLIGESTIYRILSIYNRLYSFFQKIMYPYGRYIKTPINMRKNTGKKKRMLELGPGENRLPKFETLNVSWDYHVDYILDASKPLPFFPNSFSLIYSSHVLEHIPWYNVKDTLYEWVRILEHGGHMEIWVPDGLKICETLVAFEQNGINDIHKDGWYRFNQERDPCKWASGRIFTYGDGSGNPHHWNWHRALFTPRYLRSLMEEVGLTNIRKLESKEVRGIDHGWINLGMTGTKK